MFRNNTAQPYEHVFDVPDTHSLEISKTRKVTRNNTDYVTYWINEHDERNKLIGCFRAWTKQSRNPPYRKQTGWERYSLTGELLDREVHHTTRSTDDFLH